jgi:hypothetical protein
MSTLCLFASLLFGLASTAFAQGFPRTVIVEEFTSVTCGPCKDASVLLNNLLKDQSYAGRLLSVRYHMPYPLPGDPYYNASKADVDARSSYYEVGTTLPRVRIAGGWGTVGSTNEAEMRSAINEEINLPSPVRMEVSQQRGEGNTVNVTITVTAAAGEEVDRLRVRAVAVEELIANPDPSIKNLPGYNGETEFHDVMRKLVFGASGQSVTLSSGESKTYTGSYTLDPSWTANEMRVVAWIQDDFDFTVMQAATSAKLSGAGSVGDDGVEYPGFVFGSLVPNPASGDVAMNYSIGGTESVNIELRDMSGMLIARFDEGRREIGAHRRSLDLAGLPAGIYAVTLYAGAFRQTRMLTVVR